MTFDDFLRAELVGLTRFAGVLVGSRQDAHDVLVDALIKVSTRWDTIAVMRSPVGYVRQVVLTTFLSERRKQRRRNTTPMGLEPAQDSVHLADLESVTAASIVVDRMLRQLPERQRAVLVLRYYLDFDDANIADLLGMATATVRSTAWNALRTLRVTPEAHDIRKD